DAIIRAIQMFADPSASRLHPNIIVLADGADNGSNASATDVQQAIAESDVRIFGVALEAPDFDPNAVQEMAEASGGLFLLALERCELVALYGQIQREITNVLVARFTVPMCSSGEVAFAVAYGDMSAQASGEVSGFVTTTSAGTAGTAVTFAGPNVYVESDTLPASPTTMILIAAVGAGAALALFVWILFGRKEEE